MANSKLSDFLRRYNPAVTSHWHIALAGTTWALVGLLLCRYSYGWLSPLQSDRALMFAFIGVAVSIIVYRYGMARIAQKNLERLTAIRGKKCVFGFLTWKSYANVALMITMGVMLRHSAIPKDYLSLVYTSMGSALLLGSSHYGKSLYYVLTNQ